MDASPPSPPPKTKQHSQSAADPEASVEDVALEIGNDIQGEQRVVEASAEDVPRETGNDIQGEQHVVADVDQENTRNKASLNSSGASNAPRAIETSIEAVLESESDAIQAALDAQVA